MPRFGRGRRLQCGPCRHVDELECGVERESVLKDGVGDQLSLGGARWGPRPCCLFFFAVCSFCQKPVCAAVTILCLSTMYSFR